MFLFSRTHVVAGVLLCCLAGCSREPSRDFRRSQVQAFERGIAAFEAKDFKVANEELTVALKNTTLHLDQLEVAHLTRAKARIQLRDLEAAEQDLNVLELGAANMEDVWAARGLLLKERGDTKGAELAFKVARDLNPKVVIPTKL